MCTTCYIDIIINGSQEGNDIQITGVIKNFKTATNMLFQIELSTVKSFQNSNFNLKIVQLFRKSMRRYFQLENTDCVFKKKLDITGV